mgnify:CR=1 FL=1
MTQQINPGTNGGSNLINPWRKLNFDTFFVYQNFHLICDKKYFAKSIFVKK